MDDKRKRIQILPDNLVDVIAAGEVVERPASVVKELVENAIDAGAANIKVHLVDGGRKKIQVVDDGVGMDEDDCLMAIERHATNKISSVDDLEHIATLGFRGEALPSIASVGRFTLESWDGESGSGTKILVESGKLIDVQPVGRARGTTVTLEGIFRKLPARRKFLRTKQTETAWCLGAVEDAALAKPSVSFSVVSNGTTVLEFPPASSLEERIASLWGVDTAGSMVPLSSAVDGVILEGHVSLPTLTFSRRTRHKVMVNGRPVRDPLLNRVISMALSGSWPAGRFPALVLYLAVEDDLVDVNVHPSKREMRFRRIDYITEALRRAVSGLKTSSPSFAVKGSDKPSTASLNSHNLPSDSPVPAAKEEHLPFGEPTPVSPEQSETTSLLTSTIESTDTFTQKQVLGQVLGTYIVLGSGDGLEVIDQHAAHERILFNHLMTSRAGAGASVQKLAVPLVLEMSPSEAANLLGAAELLGSFGFELGDFGSSTIRITAVPSDLKGSLIEDLLRRVASDPDALGKGPEEVALAVSRWACRDSVMAGQKLSMEEMKQLVSDLSKAESGFSCPHGRPTHITLSPQDLERLFSRR